MLTIGHQIARGLRVWVAGINRCRMVVELVRDGGGSGLGLAGKMLRCTICTAGRCYGLLGAY